jgi:hypothetical protein
MAKTPTVRSIRLLPASYGIESLSYEEGEVFYDKNSATLRVMNGVSKGGFQIATEDYVNTGLTAAVADLQGQIDDAIEAIPEVDLTPYYTKTETNVLLQNVTVDLTGYATETFVNNKIAAIPQVDLTGYATETFVNNAVSSLVDSAPSTLDTLNELAAAINDDANFAATVTAQIGLKANTADLGTAAFTNSTAYATAFQGQLADSALQPLDNVSELNNDAGYITNTALTGLASETYVDTAISNLIDGAPDQLNTLNELAAALGDNANIGSEVLAAIALKANTADLSTVAFTGDYTDLSNAEKWEDYNQRYKGRYTAAANLTTLDPLVLNLDNTVTTVTQEQSYIFDTFTTYTNVGGNTFTTGFNVNFTPVSDSYGSLRNGPQTHQWARLGNYHFSYTVTNNDGFLSAYTENPTTGALEHIRSDFFSNIHAPHTSGIIPATLVADTVNNQLILLSIATNTNTGMGFRVITWNSTDNLFATSISGSVSTTAGGQRLGNSDCQKIAAYYDETHNKIMVAFDYGIRSYFATYTAGAGAVGVSSSSFINSATPVAGAAILFQPYELLTPMPSTGDYLVTWGYNPTSMITVLIDSNGDPSWGTVEGLDNGVQDVMVHSSINRIAVLNQSSVIAGNVPEVYMYTFYADGSFGDREPAVNVDDGTVSPFNNTSRGHFDPITKKYLVYNFFDNGSTNRQRPAWSIDGKNWNYEPDLQAGDARVVDGHYSGDVAVHQTLWVGNNRTLRSNNYTTTSGPIVTNLTQDNLIGLAGEITIRGDVARVFTLGDVASGFTSLRPNVEYYVTDAGVITRDSSIATVKLGTAIDESQLNITLGKGSGSTVTVSDAPPEGSEGGDLWWESDTGRLKVYYVDNDTAQWVDASPPITQPNTPYVVGAAAGTTFVGSGFSGVQNATGNYTITFNTPLPNANYSVITTAEDILARFVFVQNKTTTSFDLLVQTDTGSASGARANFAVYNIG